jgi:hypothetical protein
MGAPVPSSDVVGPKYARLKDVSCGRSQPQLTVDDQLAAIPLNPEVLGKLPASPRFVRLPSG